MKMGWLKPNWKGLIAFVGIAPMSIIIGWGQVFAFVIPLCILYPISMYIGRFAVSKEKFSIVNIVLFIMLMAVIIPVEIICARIAYETKGEVSSFFHLLFICLNLPFVILYLRSPLTGSIATFILALLIIPCQFYLCNRLIRVQLEAARVVSYIYEEKLKSGGFPSDLSDYKFIDFEMQKYISYHPPEEKRDFAVYYHIGNRNASHSYYPKNRDGGWFYYPD